jgi:hypothetical protein
MFTASKALDQLQEHFHLPERKTYRYRDVYLTENSLAVYNGRKPYLRFRQRVRQDGSVSKQAVQVMYTASREIRTGGVSMYRCFATLKQKSGFDFGLDQNMPWTPAAIESDEVRRLVERLANAETYSASEFERYVAMDPKGLFISVDTPVATQNAGGGYWLELKSRGSVEDLQEVSNYIAWKLPVRVTTQMKCEALWGVPGSSING